jgi:hypothetical protein
MSVYGARMRHSAWAVFTSPAPPPSEDQPHKLCIEAFRSSIKVLRLSLIGICQRSSTYGFSMLVLSQIRSPASLLACSRKVHLKLLVQMFSQYLHSRLPSSMMYPKLKPLLKHLVATGSSSSSAFDSTLRRRVHQIGHRLNLRRISLGCSGELEAR